MPPQPRNPTCPICGAALQAIDVDGAPPWLCSADARSWWPSELQSRDLFNPVLRDFGTSPEGRLVGLAIAEDARKEAAARKAAK